MKRETGVLALSSKISKISEFHNNLVLKIMVMMTYEARPSPSLMFDFSFHILMVVSRL